MRNNFFLFGILFFFFSIGKITAQKEFIGKWKINRTWTDTVLTSDAGDSTVAFNYFLKKFAGSHNENSGDSATASNFSARENKLLIETRMKFMSKGKVEMLMREQDTLKTVQMLYEIDTDKKILTYKNPASTKKNNVYTYEFKNGLMYLKNNKRKLELKKVK